MKKALVLSLALIALVTAPAFAAVSLSAKQVESFIASMGSVDTLADEMAKEGKQEALQANMQAMTNEGFLPYTSSIKVLKDKFGGDYEKLGGIVKKHGFSSQEEWAGIGDAVMLSYMALKAEESNPNYAAASAQMTPEMMANLPPETRAQVEQGMKMMNAIKAAPAEHKSVVKPFIPNIEQWINAQTKAAAPQ